MCTSVQAGYSREREGPQCWGQNQLFGCPCSSPEVVEGRRHWFTDIFATRQVTPYSFCYDLTKKIKMQSWGTWGPVWSPLIHKRGRKKQWEDTGGVLDPLRLFSHVPKVLLLLSSSLHHRHQEHTLGCLRHICTLHPSLQADRQYG